MSVSLLLDEIKTQKIGKAPVVVLPLNVWKDIEERLEDLEMAQSVFLKEKIIKARSEKKVYSSAQVKKSLGF